MGIDDNRFNSLIDSSTPFIAELNSYSTERITIVIATYDFPSVFSLLVGVISSLGIDIRSGRIETLTSGIILDNFNAILPDTLSVAAARKALTSRLEELTSLLLEEKPDSARRRVNEWVSLAIQQQEDYADELLQPVELNVEPKGDSPAVWIDLKSQNSSFFLYSVATAITLQNISIDQVEIKTSGNTIHDRFKLTPHREHDFDRPETLGRLKFSILLTKQFTWFLKDAPDPYAAIVRFETMIEDLILTSDPDRWMDLLDNPNILHDLARLLGTSNFFWEDFFRLQYENILPLLQENSGMALPKQNTSRRDFEFRLQAALSKIKNFKDKVKALNKFKDDEIFKIDLYQMLHPDEEFLSFSQDLTSLAEAVVSTAFSLAENRLKERFGTPRTIAGIPVSYGVLGLGKLGGTALGYASDIELLCLYSDMGKTDGATPIENTEFYNRLVKDATSLIEAKQEGIFHVDLRLRPHGSAGPHASSLQHFTEYYQNTAHSFERLALVRLRYICGSEDFGKRVESIRDEIIYSEGSINLTELQALRKKQLQEKSSPGQFNAKFSTGALVDIEYTVQILQIIHGREDNSLRTPSVGAALSELARAGVVQGQVAEEIRQAYFFLRKLINALRMLRGNALDLWLPERDSDEFRHLARRMNYSGNQKGMLPQDRLLTDFAEKTALVRRFVEQSIGSDSLASPGEGTIADVILNPEMPDDRKKTIFHQYGFSNPERGIYNIESLAQAAGSRKNFAIVAVLAMEELKRISDPDMALNNWERFISGTPGSGEYFNKLLEQPTRITLLIKLFAGSQFLSDILILEPDLFTEATDPEGIGRPLERNEYYKRIQLRTESDLADENSFVEHLRRQKKIEYLRTGIRDICFNAPLEEIIAELSYTAESQITAALNFAWKEHGGKGDPPIIIGAFGKLGGEELNYSSDLDVIGIRSSEKSTSRLSTEEERRLLMRIRHLLSAPSAFGRGYRIDFRLRPYGQSGAVVTNITGLEDYYRNHAGIWEIQALLKLSLISPDKTTNKQFLEVRQKLLLQASSPGEIIRENRNNRDLSLKHNKDVKAGRREIKNGPGGIRDIEFTVQVLQLIHGRKNPDLYCTSTLEALHRLGSNDILSISDQYTLTRAYRFFRRTEHFLQLFEDLQLHTLPDNPQQLSLLARRSAGMTGQDFKILIEKLSNSVLQIQNTVYRQYE